MKVAIYPGSFDPITNGHIDIIKRTIKMFDKVYICVANNIKKNYVFTLEERINLVKESLKDIKGIEVIHTEDLVINVAKEVGAQVMIRGLRAVSDFEYEFVLAEANSYIDNNIETIFLMASTGNGFISSSAIKEFALHNVDVSKLVPSAVNKALKEKYKE